MLISFTDKEGEYLSAFFQFNIDMFEALGEESIAKKIKDVMNEVSLVSRFIKNKDKLNFIQGLINDVSKIHIKYLKNS